MILLLIAIIVLLSLILATLQGIKSDLLEIYENEDENTVGGEYTGYVGSIPDKDDRTEIFEPKIYEPDSELKKTLDAQKGDVRI